MEPQDYEKELQLLAIKKQNIIMDATITKQNAIIYSMSGELTIMQAIIDMQKKEIEELKEELERRNTNGSKQAAETN